MSDLKNELYKQCVDYVQKRMNTTSQAIEEAQQAVNEETKSSAGDKYETSREMMQQETNRNIVHLNEANKLMVALNQINTSNTTDKADVGSVVTTTNGKFYIAISAGTLEVNGQNYVAVSPASPIGLKLTGVKAGDEFQLNGVVYNIEGVE